MTTARAGSALGGCDAPRGRGAVRTPSRTHGFTIIETLVVLALLVVLAALAAPSLSGMSDTASFDEAIEMTRSSGAVARAEAATRGEPVELVALTTPEGGQMLLVRRFSEATPGPASAAQATAPASPVLLEIGEFGRAIRVRAGSPSPENGANDSETESASAASEIDMESDAIVLGVYWPSGTSRMSEAWFIEGPGDRMVSGTINPWTGAIDLAPIARAKPDADIDDDTGSSRDSAMQRPGGTNSATQPKPAPEPTKPQPPKPTSSADSPAPNSPDSSEESSDEKTPPKQDEDDDEEEEQP